MRLLFAQVQICCVKLQTALEICPVCHAFDTSDRQTPVAKAEIDVQLYCTVRGCCMLMLIVVLVLNSTDVRTVFSIWQGMMPWSFEFQVTFDL